MCLIVAAVKQPEAHSNEYPLPKTIYIESVNANESVSTIWSEIQMRLLI